MANKNGVKYGKTVHKAVKAWKLDKDILNATELTKETRKEIQRVFHAANRRLQNIETSGAFSPAAAAVNSFLSEFDEISNFNAFAKFSTSGKDFAEIKRLYSAAIEFMQKPTSTAQGSRQFETEIKKRANVKYDAEWEYIKDGIKSGKFTENGKNIAALVPSDPTKVLDYFTTAMRDIADEIENAAENNEGLDMLKNALQSDIQQQFKQGFPTNPTPLFDAFETFE